MNAGQVCPTCLRAMPACGGVSNNASPPFLGKVCHDCDKRLTRGTTAGYGMFAPKPATWTCGRCGRSRTSDEPKTDHTAYIGPLCQRCVQEVVVPPPVPESVADALDYPLTSDGLSRALDAKEARIRELEAELRQERAMRRVSAERMVELLDKAKHEIAVRDWERAGEQKP